MEDAYLTGLCAKYAHVELRWWWNNGHIPPGRFINELELAVRVRFDPPIEYKIRELDRVIKAAPSQREFQIVLHDGRVSNEMVPPYRVDIYKRFGIERFLFD